MSASPLGRFVWYQLNSTDLDAAVSFYREIVGWKTEAWRGGDDPYTLLNRPDGAPVGGAMNIPAEARDAGAPQHWLAYISTPDVDKTMLQAKDNGATVFVPPTDLPEVGRFSVLADPQGAVFAIYTPSSAPEDTAFAPGIGDASWHELMTGDYQAAMPFYFDLFGWQATEAMDMGDMGTYQMFGRNGDTLGGMMSTPPGVDAPPHWAVYFRVPDVDASAERIAGLGGQVFNGPMDVPGGDRVLQALDPQGGAFSLHSTG